MPWQKEFSPQECKNEGCPETILQFFGGGGACFWGELIWLMRHFEMGPCARGAHLLWSHTPPPPPPRPIPPAATPRASCHFTFSLVHRTIE